jgi:tetratricopeptide (TPR) repeat protein
LLADKVTGFPRYESTFDMRQFRKMRFTAAFIILVALVAATGARAGTPIEIVYGRGRNRVAMKLWQDAEDQLNKGDVENARRNVDAAIRSDPTLWPALYTRAKVFMMQRKYELAVQDCSEALRQCPTFIEAALLRAGANEALGRHAACLKEIEHVISIRPRSDALGRAYGDRAWLRATCPDPAFRDGKQAIKDATAACKFLHWDEGRLDTLAAAYAEAGDFDSAVRYEEQALGTKGISAEDAKVFQHHLELFRQHRPIRASD